MNQSPHTREGYWTVFKGTSLYKICELILTVTGGLTEDLFFLLKLPSDLAEISIFLSEFVPSSMKAVHPAPICPCISTSTDRILLGAEFVVSVNCQYKLGELKLSRDPGQIEIYLLIFLMKTFFLKILRKSFCCLRKSIFCL